MGEIDAALTMSVDKYGHAEFPRRDAIARAILEARAKVLECHVTCICAKCVELSKDAALCREAAGRIKSCT